MDRQPQYPQIHRDRSDRSAGQQTQSIEPDRVPSHSPHCGLEPRLTQPVARTGAIAGGRDSHSAGSGPSRSLAVYLRHWVPPFDRGELRRAGVNEVRPTHVGQLNQIDEDIGEFLTAIAVTRTLLVSAAIRFA